MNFRTLASSVAFIRSALGAAAGKTFDGARDFYLALGYKRVLTVEDYRDRYRRNAVAARIVEAKPQDTWRGGFDLLERDDNATEESDKATAFEDAWDALDRRLKITSTMLKADVLAGLGHYSVVVLVAPGAMDTPLETCSPDALLGLQAYCEDDAPIDAFDTDPTSARYGRPTFYTLKRTASKKSELSNIGKRVHFSRVLHIADGALEDPVYGQPRLERVWNLLDDLDKITGGGAEAFWNRANQGMQVDIDPTLDLDDEAKREMQEQVDDYRHKLERVLRTRGTKINMLGSDVSDFRGPAEAIMAQISAGCGIPQRVLTGSEQGKLAAEQDSVKYYRLIEARRSDFAEQHIVRPFIDRLIELTTLPQPARPYEVSWSQTRTMDESERADLALKLSQLNATWTASGLVIKPNEIRGVLSGRPLNLAPFTAEEEQALIDGIKQKNAAPVPGAEPAPNTGERADGQERGLTSRRKEEPSWKGVHRAADRFPREVQAGSTRGVRRRA